MMGPLARVQTFPLFIYLVSYTRRVYNSSLGLIISTWQTKMMSKLATDPYSTWFKGCGVGKEMEPVKQKAMNEIMSSNLRNYPTLNFVSPSALQKLVIHVGNITRIPIIIWNKKTMKPNDYPSSQPYLPPLRPPPQKIKHKNKKQVPKDT